MTTSNSDGKWFQRLEYLAPEDRPPVPENDQAKVAKTNPWTGTSIQKDFFGEDWILPQVFWEALAADRIGTLEAPLKRLLAAPFQLLYLDDGFSGQGQHLAEGAIYAVLAACRDLQQRDDPTAAMGHLQQAAAAFDRAWPAPPGKMATGSIVRDPCFAAYSAGVAAPTVGFWTAWDLFDRLLGRTHEDTGRRLAITELPGRWAASHQVAEFARIQTHSNPSPKAVTPPTARLPLLLVDSDTSEGRLALLTVTLIPDGGGVFCPDPLAMGLSALWGGGTQKSDASDIHASMQRIWRLTGLGDRYRGRWSFTALTADTILGLAKPGSADPLISACFSGRSAEAAVWCALQSAASDAEHRLRLDQKATVTAMLDADAAGGDVGQIPLKRIEGIVSKTHAAKDFLQMVIVADEQEQVRIDGRIEIVQVDTAGKALDRLLSVYHHVRNYQQHVEHQWEEDWATEKKPEEQESKEQESEKEGQANEGQRNEREESETKPSETKKLDNPPFIESQRILLLTELQHPRKYLHPAAFRSRRQGASRSGGAADLDADKWVEISRDQFLGVEPIEGCDLHRMVVTTDAGIGKTANLEWLHWKINAARCGRLALLVKINELAGSYDQFLPKTLVDCFRRKVDGNSGEQLEQDEAELILRRLRDAGQIVLLFDALDQTGAASPQIKVLCEIVAHTEWRHCRIVITGRPHALVRHWDTLLEKDNLGWRYFRLLELEKADQIRYLGQTASGKSRYEKILPGAREILGTPRVLTYLRGLSDDDLEKIRTPSDVYFKSLRHLIKEGMEQSEEARLIDLPADKTKPSAKVRKHQVDRAMKLLAVIAFEMTKQPDPAATDESSVPPPNFDQIAPGDFNDFRDRICRRLPEAHTGADIDRLAALNGILQHGFFDSGDADGLQQILWRNTSLQEFCAAYWMSQFSTKKDTKTVNRWLYLPDDPLSEAYYWIWRYATEMPEAGRNKRRWPRAMSPLYQPGDCQTARRSNEMIYRSWTPMEQYPDGRKILNRFMSEFEQIKDGGQGTPEQQQAAAEFAASFVAIPAGTFKLGRPQWKEVPPDEKRRLEWEDWLRNRTLDEIVEQLWPSIRFTGPEGRERRKQIIEHWWPRLQMADGREQLARWLSNPDPQDEVLEEADREQEIKEPFQFCRDPLLNRWYRLFDPQHGFRPWYHLKDVDYSKYSPDPDTPVIYVSWYDAWVFCRWACWDGQSCHLPSERQWEYAAKAGEDDQHYWWGDTFKAERCNAEGRMGRTNAPDDGHCNRWGLRDILGNVWEWCQDWYGAYSAELPEGPSWGSLRVSRGGSWYNGPMLCRSAVRGRNTPEDRDYDLGFRPARSSVRSGTG